MGRFPRRALRRRQRATHRALNSGGHRYDSVEALVPVAGFTRVEHDFLIAVPIEVALGGSLVDETTSLSLVMTNRQGYSVEVARFRFERDHDQVVLEWTVAVHDTDWDLEANRYALQEVTTAFCAALFAGRPIDPALGIRPAPGLAATVQDRHGDLVALNLGDSDG